MNNVTSIVQTGMSYLAQVGPKGWFAGFVVALIAGIVCMRGYGSRSNY